MIFDRSHTVFYQSSAVTVFTPYRFLDITHGMLVYKRLATTYTVSQKGFMLPNFGDNFLLTIFYPYFKCVATLPCKPQNVVRMKL